MGVEFVFLYGPPYAGKTLFYLNHFQATHLRVCPSAIFDSEPDVTLRSLILKIVTILKKGQSVVLDDENEFRHTRASYINLIKTKVPDCRLLCIELLANPSHGHLQCNWAREWNIAQAFLGERWISKFNPLEKERKLCQWFDEEKIDAPCESEGFEVSRLQIGLSCESPFKFEIPALIIQMEVLSPEKADDDPSNLENLSILINTWSSITTTGRVIFLGNIQHSCSQAGPGEDTCIGKETSKYVECCSCLNHTQERLRQLALKVNTPLYFALVDYSLLKYPFIIPPQPGPIAWIQRLHTIDITHKSSLYVCTTETHTKMAQSAGLKTFKAKSVLNNPKLVTAIRTKQSAVPVCVSDSTVYYHGKKILPSALELESTSSASSARPSPQIPLLDKARDSRKQVQQSCFVTEFAMGRCHGVCFKNLEMLEKYQELYKKSASPTEDFLCTPFKPDCIKPLVASEATDRQKIVTTVLKLAEDEQDVNADSCHETDLKTLKSDGKTAVSSEGENEKIQGLASYFIKIEPEDIEMLALSESRYKKGKAMQHLIKDLITTPDNAEELLQISCTCKGSQGQYYDVFAIIGNHGIKQAKCSCLDSAGKTGQCKHVVAMLLMYVDMYVCKDEHNIKSGKHSKSFQRKRKSSKRAAGWQNTIYVMSSQELLETAHQILQEHSQSNKNKAEDEKDESEVFSKETKTPKDILSIKSSRELPSEKETTENASDTSMKQHKSFFEDELLKRSPRIHFTEKCNQTTEEERTDITCSLYEETKRQKKSYGKSILDEII